MLSKKTSTGTRDSVSAAGSAGKNGKSLPAVQAGEALLQKKDHTFSDHAVVQCAFGFEMESNVHYVVPKNEEDPLPGKRDKLITGSKINLEAENAGYDRNVEFATPTGGLDSPEEMKIAMLEFATIAKNLKSVPQYGSKGVEELGSESLNLQGDKRYDIHNFPPRLKKEMGISAPIEGHSTPFSGFMQATLGIPLAKMPEFFRLLEKSSIADPTHKELYKELTPEESTTEGLSPDAIGLITLINHIIKAGSITNKPKAEFPKSLVGVMNRTDFHTMFHLLPEIVSKSVTPEDMEIRILKALTEKNIKRLVFEQEFKVSDKKDPPYKIGLTIEDWIMHLDETDLLALEKKNFGHLGKKVDIINDQPVPIVEFRAIANDLPAIDDAISMAKWLKRAYDILGIYEQINDLKQTDAKADIREILEKVYSVDEAQNALDELEGKKKEVQQEEKPNHTAYWIIGAAIVVLGFAAYKWGSKKPLTE